MVREVAHTLPHYDFWVQSVYSNQTNVNCTVNRFNAAVIRTVCLSEMGASIYDVHKIKLWVFFTPPAPHLSEFYVLFVHKIKVFSDPHPPQCERHIWKPPKGENAKN